MLTSVTMLIVENKTIATTTTTSAIDTTRLLFLVQCYNQEGFIQITIVVHILFKELKSFYKTVSVLSSNSRTSNTVYVIS